jgi:hypothetical protein
MPSLLRTASVIVAVFLYGFIAIGSAFPSVYAKGRTPAAVVCSLDKGLHDIPARLSSGDWDAKFTSKNSEPDWILGRAISTVSFQRRLSSYISYATTVVVGFNRTDVIYPFHYFF